MLTDIRMFAYVHSVILLRWPPLDELLGLPWTALGGRREGWIDVQQKRSPLLGVDGEKRKFEIMKRGNLFVYLIIKGSAAAA